MNLEHREAKPLLSSKERKELLQKKINELSEIAKNKEKIEDFKRELGIAERRGYKMAIAINAKNPAQRVADISADRAAQVLKEKNKDDLEPIIFIGHVIEYLPYSPPHIKQSVKIVKLMVDPEDVRLTTTDSVKIEEYQKCMKNVDEYYRTKHLDEEKNDIFLLVDQKLRPLPLALHEAGYYK